jgi:Ca2+-binding EF-hand superfamily protein
MRRRPCAQGQVSKAEFRAVLPMIGFDASDTERLDELFDTFDVDGSGSVDYNELNKMLRQGASVELAEELRDGAAGEIEVERKNKIKIRTDIEHRDASSLTPVESVAQLREALLNGWTRVIDVFRMLDRDASGGVTKPEFRGALPLLGFDSSDSGIVDALFDELDADGGGTLEYEEVFEKLERYEGWQSQTPTRPSDAKAELIAAKKMEERGEMERGMGALAESQTIWHG